ncbi:MAG: glutathione S-transferase C-terminal domain-containing protein [Thermodesulfobacteriota bacterium]
MPTLIAEYFAPWSEKARWALDHHQLAYGYREHVPLLGEIALRARTGRWRGRVSTPALVTDDGVLHDSFDIARWAEAHGRGAPLLPPGREGAVASWNARSESALSAGRALYLARLSRDPRAQVEMQPRALPGWLRRAMAPATGLAVAFIRRKYGIDGAASVLAEGALVRELDGLRSALAGRAHLLGDALSYADVAMAVTLQFVAPVDTRYVPLGPAALAAWTHAGLAERYGDLVAWRDALYARHRPDRATAG